MQSSLLALKIISEMLGELVAGLWESKTRLGHIARLGLVLLQRGETVKVRADLQL